MWIVRFLLYAGDDSCVSEGEDSESLTKLQLKKILDTTAGQKVHSTIIVIDDGKKVYTHDSNPLDAYNDMRRTYGSQPSDIWVNYSPCPPCARALLKEYKSPTKPNIHIAKVNDNTVESLKWLAKLEHCGFNLLLWDFVTFTETFKLESICEDEIKKQFNDAEFMSEYMKTKNLLEFVRQISKHPDANWCCDNSYKPDCAPEYIWK